MIGDQSENACDICFVLSSATLHRAGTELSIGKTKQMKVSQIFWKRRLHLIQLQTMLQKQEENINQLGKIRKKRKEKIRKKKKRPPVIGGEEVMWPPSQLENNSVMSVILRLDQWGSYSAPRPWRITACPVSNYFYDTQSMYIYFVQLYIFSMWELLFIAQNFRQIRLCVYSSSFALEL